MKTPTPPAATDHENDAEDQGDALCRACARARTTVVPALGRALDHPLAQLLTGLLTVFALFGDDVHTAASTNNHASLASRPTESFALDATRLRSDAIDARGVTRAARRSRHAGPHPRLRRREQRRLHLLGP